jgi:Protein of unknown function (DUF1353)
MTGRFLDPLVVSLTNDGIHWFTCAPFRYQRDRNDPATAIRVPVGFLTDFTSTPRGVWGLLPPWGIYGQASLVHDVLYWFQTTDRATADLVLLEAMEALNVADATRWAIYKAVSEFGQIAWDENARARVGGAERIAYVPVTVTKR